MTMKPIRECTFYFRNKIFHKYANNLKKTRGRSDVSAQYSSVGEDLAIGGLELVGA
jgi:hypothetical protein